MPRAKGGYKTRRRRNKWLDVTKGFSSVSNNVYKKSRERGEYALANAFAGRKMKKRQYRRLWTVRINAAARLNGTTYSRLIGALHKSGIELNRKILADLAVRYPDYFAEVCKQAK